MSGFYVLALLAIWALLTKWLWKGGRRLLNSEFGNRWVRVALVAAVAMFWLGGTFWEVAGKKMYWDARVRKLCAIDGGVKVYETVVLSPEVFDRYAKRNWMLPNKSQATLTDEYYVEREEFVYHKDDPKVVRWLTRAIRAENGMVLGEYIQYARIGGDFPGPWHESSFSCSDIERTSGFARSIFIRGKHNEYDN